MNPQDHINNLKTIAEEKAIADEGFRQREKQEIKFLEGLAIEIADFLLLRRSVAWNFNDDIYMEGDFTEFYGDIKVDINIKFNEIRVSDQYDRQAVSFPLSFLTNFKNKTKIDKLFIKEQQEIKKEDRRIKLSQFKKLKKELGK